MQSDGAPSLRMGVPSERSMMMNDELSDSPFFGCRFPIQHVCQKDQDWLCSFARRDLQLFAADATISRGPDSFYLAASMGTRPWHAFI